MAIAGIFGSWRFIINRHYRIHLTVHMIVTIICVGLLLTSSYLELVEEKRLRQLSSLLLLAGISNLTFTSIKQLELMHSLYPNLDLVWLKKGTWAIIPLNLILLGPMYYEIIFLSAPGSVSTMQRLIRYAGILLLVLSHLLFIELAMWSIIKRLLNMRSKTKAQQKLNESEDPDTEQQDKIISRFVNVSYLGIFFDVAGMLMIVAHTLTPVSTPQLMEQAQIFYVLACFLSATRLPLLVVSFAAIQYISFPKRASVLLHQNLKRLSTKTANMSNRISEKKQVVQDLADTVPDIEKPNGSSLAPAFPDAEIRKSKSR
ncbi:hypothetical protein EDD86DRAFT_270420 [Gorgonomyces haynaldii]|nr:hypothetical protein EDD86DRAFT_270420 [Gorgonomyces haynaldii]